MKTWYTAKIIFTIRAQNTTHKPQFDEQLRLIQATGPEEAFLKARMIGLAEEDAFINSSNNLVKWEFVNVAEISPVNSLEDGAELTSRLYEMEEAQEHIHYVHQKAITLRLNSRPLF